MADTSNMEAPKVDVTPAATEEKNVNVPTETVPVEKSEGEVPAETTTEPVLASTPTPAIATEESSNTATEEYTASPVATESKTEETKPAEEKEEPKTEEPKAEEPKAEELTEPANKEASPRKSTAFDEFDAKVPGIIKEIDHDEMWGVKLVTPASSQISTQIVLQKFLNANDGDLTKAVEQFKGALKFRKEKKPLELVKKTFNASKFAELGAVTVYPVKDSTVPEVFTWNLYGNVKGRMEEVFAPLDEFMEYRIALQELGIQQLKLSDATEAITAENDPYKIMQVHDYKSISFLRQPPAVKTAKTEIIKQFALAYPELLKASLPNFFHVFLSLLSLPTIIMYAPLTNPSCSYQQEKFFVNVPAIMGWMYALVKVFVAEKTARKFHPMANGGNLAAELKGSGVDKKQLPKEYGGEGGSGDGNMKDIPGLVDELKFE